MLATRIIPTMLVRGRTLVKGSQFNSWRSVGHAAQAARIHAMRGVDELILLDIGATPEGRGPDLDLVRELSEFCFTPITVGGGVRSMADVEALLQAGADKVAICTGAFEIMGLLEQCAARFGRQAIVACIDVKASRPAFRCGTYTLDGGASPRDVARAFESQGAGEIMLTSIDKEGTMGGYELDLIWEVAMPSAIPVIAHGGCSGYPDMLAAIKAGASAVAAGALFQFTDATPRGAAEYLQEQGIDVRL